MGFLLCVIYILLNPKEKAIDKPKVDIFVK